MKRKMLMSMLAAALSASLLAGCGNTAKPADSGSVVTAGEEDGTDAAQEADAAEEPGSEAPEEADVAEEPGAEAPEEADVAEEPGAENEPEEADAADAQQESEESAMPEDETEQETVSWLEEHGVTITPQGDSSVKFYSYDSYPEDYVDDFMADVNVTISETTEGAEEGFKKVVAEITYDVSNSPDACTAWMYSYGVFDRDTGVYFRGDVKTKEAVEIEGEYFDVRTEWNKSGQYPIYHATYTLDCPADYDGAVFLFGYHTPEMREIFNQIDLTTRLYTLDELPYDMESLWYWTLTDE